MAAGSNSWNHNNNNRSDPHSQQFAAATAAPVVVVTDGIPNSKKKKQFKKNPNAPKRFRSAFILFSIHKHRELREQAQAQQQRETKEPKGAYSDEKDEKGPHGEGDDASSEKEGAEAGDNKKTKKSTTTTSSTNATMDIARQVSLAWRAMGPDERKHWEVLAMQDKARYMTEKEHFAGPWMVPFSGKRRPKDPTAPKKAVPAYFLFSNARRQDIKNQHPMASNGEISRILAQMWKEAPDDVKQTYLEGEQKSRDRYAREMEEWKRRQQHSSNKKQHQTNAIQDSTTTTPGPNNGPGTQNGVTPHLATTMNPQPQNNPQAATAMMMMNHPQINMNVNPAASSATVGVGGVNNTTMVMNPTAFPAAMMGMNAQGAGVTNNPVAGMMDPSSAMMMMMAAAAAGNNNPNAAAAMLPALMLAQQQQQQPQQQQGTDPPQQPQQTQQAPQNNNLQAAPAALSNPMLLMNHLVASNPAFLGSLMHQFQLQQQNTNNNTNTTTTNSVDPLVALLSMQAQGAQPPSTAQVVAPVANINIPTLQQPQQGFSNNSNQQHDGVGNSGGQATTTTIPAQALGASGAALPLNQQQQLLMQAQQQQVAGRDGLSQLLQASGPPVTTTEGEATGSTQARQDDQFQA